MTAPAGSAAGRDVWDRAIVVWDLAFLVAVAVAVVVTLESGLDDRPAGAGAVALLALAGWYAGCRRPRSAPPLDHAAAWSTWPA